VGFPTRFGRILSYFLAAFGGELSGSGFSTLETAKFAKSYSVRILFGRGLCNDSGGYLVGVHASILQQRKSDAIALKYVSS
jgi:hypothetical protein